MAMLYKPEIRDKMIRRRNRLEKVSVIQAAQQVAAVVVMLKEFLEAKHIGSYFPLQNEIETYPIMEAAENLKKKLYLPASENFLPYKLGDALENNSQGFLQPQQSILRAAKDLDVIFLPMVAFDTYCNRVGRGAGYYDRLLAFLNPRTINQKPFLIGLAYEFQKIPAFKFDKWDVPLDLIVTEKNTYTR